MSGAILHKRYEYIGVDPGEQYNAEITYWESTARCCGRDITVASEDRLPYWVSSRHTPHWEVKDAPAQCGGCGSLHSADYRVKGIGDGLF